MGMGGLHGQAVRKTSNAVDRIGRALRIHNISGFEITSTWQDGQFVKEIGDWSGAVAAIQTFEPGFDPWVADAEELSYIAAEEREWEGMLARGRAQHLARRTVSRNN